MEDDSGVTLASNANESQSSAASPGSASSDWTSASSASAPSACVPPPAWLPGLGGSGARALAVPSTSDTSAVAAVSSNVPMSTSSAPNALATDGSSSNSSSRLSPGV